MNLYQIAQQVTDEVLGKGTYKQINKFDPGKGETRQSYPEPAKRKRKTRRNP
jgi:hypothetical protein